MISIAGSTMPLQDSFRIAEALLLMAMDSDSKRSGISKKELLTIIHSLTMRKV
jgi:hypothetical protein